MSYPIKGDNDSFDCYDEFLDNISRGGEVVFNYKGKRYTLTHGTADDGCHVVYFGIANSDNIAAYRIENNNFDVIGNLELDGKAIRNVVTEFDLLFRCF